MKIRAILAMATAGTVLLMFAAVPQVSNVDMSQNAEGTATIIYTLAAASAVVTLDIQTNTTGGAWVSIGGEAVSTASGDVWKVVGAGSRTIKWDGATNWADRQIPANGIRAVVTAWSLDNTPDYMVVDLASTGGPDTQKYYVSTNFIPGGLLGNDDYRTTKIVMRKIMAKGMGWTMGSPDSETGHNSSEKTHSVTLTNNYYIGVFEVTQSQYALIAGSNPSYFNNVGYTAMRPVERVTFNGVRGASEWPNDPVTGTFLYKLRDKTGIDFDLPSEAQWEFACRAGNGTGKWGDGSVFKSEAADENLSRLARFYFTAVGYNSPAQDCDATGGTALVGSYAPNNWGLYDMHGNVMELCLDRYVGDNTAYGVTVNTSEGSSRVRRGGCWSQLKAAARPAARNNTGDASNDNIHGIRLVCTAGLK